MTSKANLANFSDCLQSCQHQLNILKCRQEQIDSLIAAFSQFTHVSESFQKEAFDLSRNSLDAPLAFASKRFSKSDNQNCKLGPSPPKNSDPPGNFQARKESPSLQKIKMKEKKIAETYPILLPGEQPKQPAQPKKAANLRSNYSHEATPILPFEAEPNDKGASSKLFDPIFDSI